MLNINNNASRLKRDILTRIIRLQIEGRLKEGLSAIPREIAPKGSSPIRCCIYHDRELLRQRVIVQLGFSLENYDDEKLLAEYVDEALSREKPTSPILTVLDEACNACVRTRFMITNACQACLARPCLMNCGKKAISIYGGRAHIDEEKCVNCGLCLGNCPYHAIIKIPVPCEEACPVGAISKDDGGKERIDYDRCIFCGNCMRECPFSAMTDKYQIVDVLNNIMRGKKVIALYAPAAAAQFREGAPRLEGALLAAGFSDVIEVALGADVTAEKEAEEFIERADKGEKMMTTSCCYAYTRAVRRHVPELADCISNTSTPMHYAARAVKEKTQDSVTVFIGPCLAKRREGADDQFVDYVISVEETAALFEAKNIDLNEVEPHSSPKKASPEGRRFAKAGGVAEAVRARLKDPSRLKEFSIDGLNKAGMKKLAELGKINCGKLPVTDNTPNLIEVMACEGGCISGPCVITQPKTALALLEKYACAT